MLAIPLPSLSASAAPGECLQDLPTALADALLATGVQRQWQRGQQLMRQGTPCDSLLVALGTVLVVVPGLASSVLGALMLVPFTRRAVRPAAKALFSRQLTPMDFPTQVIYINHDERYRGRGEYIDGEVIEVIDSSPVVAQPHAS